ncbi:hypothetical protein AAVH_29189 [Aphelenchoides avenae]|nr:hypothetical protein AAVH_29189 [Aphelenchus avenae]
MHLNLFYESFFFSTRDDLESLQLVRRSLLNMIVAGSSALPLRPLSAVYYSREVMKKDYKFRIFVDEDPSYEVSMDDGDVADIFFRLQHTCIKHFSVGIRDSPFLRYWKAQEDAIFIVERINFCLTDDTDYDVLDSMVNHIRPRTTTEVDVWADSWHEDGVSSKYLKVLARDSFLNSLKICRLTAWAFPPPSFFLNEPGYPIYELWCYDSNLADGIDGFIESFVRDGCANEKFESMWTKKPTKIDLPLPENTLTAGLIHQMSPCEVHSFANMKQQKRLEVHKWTFEDICWNSRGTIHILQCRVDNL